MKGLSLTHYLIKFTHFIHCNLDKRESHAVTAAFIDLSKAFNRVDHSLVIQDLYDMHCPAWLLKLMASFLSNRKLILAYKGQLSSEKLLPGGGPQGSYLGGLTFIITWQRLVQSIYNGKSIHRELIYSIFQRLNHEREF